MMLNKLKALCGETAVRNKKHTIKRLGERYGLMAPGVYYTYIADAISNRDYDVLVMRKDNTLCQIIKVTVRNVDFYLMYNNEIKQILTALRPEMIGTYIKSSEWLPCRIK